MSKLPKRVWSGKKLVFSGKKAVREKDWQIGVYQPQFEEIDSWEVYDKKRENLDPEAPLDVYDSSTPEYIGTMEDGILATYTFYNYDRSVLKQGTCKDWETPIPPADPTRDSDWEYDYQFAWWNPAVWPIAKDTDYVASFNETKRLYTVYVSVNDSDYGSLDIPELTVEAWTEILDSSLDPTLSPNQLKVWSTVVTATANAWYEFDYWTNWNQVITCDQYPQAVFKVATPSWWRANQGPADSWFHVPTKTEWDNLVTLAWSIWATVEDLKIPFTWWLDMDPDIYNQGLSWYYWCCDYGKRLYIDSANFWTDTTNNMGSWYTIRAFKDTPVVPDGTWTTIIRLNDGLWLFWDQTNWLLSISDDLVNWITIQDKNIGATQVWMNWATLSENNCWKYFQRWNNYWFPFNWQWVSTSSDPVDTTWYGPGNYYSDSTYITPYTNFWSSVPNDNLRGGAAAESDVLDHVHVPSENQIIIGSVDQLGFIDLSKLYVKVDFEWDPEDVNHEHPDQWTGSVQIGNCQDDYLTNALSTVFDQTPGIRYDNISYLAWQWIVSLNSTLKTQLDSLIENPLDQQAIDDTYAIAEQEHWGVIV